MEANKYVLFILIYLKGFLVGMKLNICLKPLQFLVFFCLLNKMPDY